MLLETAAVVCATHETKGDRIGSGLLASGGMS